MNEELIGYTGIVTYLIGGLIFCSTIPSHFYILTMNTGEQVILLKTLVLAMILILIGVVMTNFEIKDKNGA